MNKHLAIPLLFLFSIVSIHSVQAERLSADARPRLESRDGNSVDTATGAFIQDINLVSIQGARDLSFDIHYDSKKSFEVSRQKRGSLGLGWTHPYEAYMLFPGSSIGQVYRNAFTYSEYIPNDFSDLTKGYQLIAQVLESHDTLHSLGEGKNVFQKLDGSSLWFDQTRLVEIRDKNHDSLIITRKTLPFLFKDNRDGEIKLDAFNVAGTITEPVSNQKIVIGYAENRENYYKLPLINFLEYGGLKRYLRYDRFDRLKRVYDPVKMSVASPLNGEFFIPRTDVDLFIDFKEIPFEVSRTETNRLIELKGTIKDGTSSGIDPLLKYVAAEFISPSGTSVPVKIKPGGEISMVLDEFLEESLEGTWVLRVNISFDYGFPDLSTLIYDITAEIFAADEDANWTEYQYGVGASNQIVRASDGRGKQIYANTYDNKNRVVVQADGRSNLWRFSYEDLDDEKLLTRVTSRKGGVTTYVHDEDFNLLSIENPLFSQTEFGYTPSTGDRNKIIDPMGNITDFGYDDDGYLTSMMDQSTGLHRFNYIQDSSGRRKLLRGIRDPAGPISLFDYDGAGRLIKITSPNQQITQGRRYSGTGQLTLTLNKGGNGIEYEYTNGLPTAAWIVDTPDKKEILKYDNLGRVIETTDTEGNTSTIVYDNRGNIIERKNALGQTIKSTYDHRNRLIETEDQRGNITSYTYDGNGNPIGITNALGQTTQYTYDAEDRLILVKDPAGNVIDRKEYNLAGQLFREHTGSNFLEYTYDANGNNTLIRDSRFRTLSETVFDNGNRPISQTDVRGNTTLFEYDTLGQLIKQTDPTGRVTEFGYDLMNRVDNVRQAGREYDKVFAADDVLEAIIDADGNRTEFFYFSRNQLDTFVTPGGSISDFIYNSAGFVTDYLPPILERAQHYLYDSSRRLNRVQHVDEDEPDIIYEYDEAGNTVQISIQFDPLDIPTVEIERTYDALNRRISTTDLDGNTISQTFGAAGLVSRITYPDGKTVDYTYDLSNRLEKVTDWAGRVTKYTWGFDDQIEEIEFPNGTKRVLQYSEERILRNRADYDAQNQIIVSYDYAYDENGFLTSELVDGASPTAYTPPTATFEYDIDNRLITLNGESIDYDEDGNVVKGPVLGASRNLLWDARNNLVDDEIGKFEYDVEDRLIGWSNDDEAIAFTVVDAPEGSRIMVSENDVGLVTRYVYGVGLAYEDVDGEIKVHHYDERGSSRAYTDDSGLVSGEIEYGPFGEIVARSGDTTSIFKYGALFGVVAAPNELNYMRFRWYSPGMKRFLSRDSVLGDIKLPSSLNAYLFAGNNPINFNDPNGEWLHIVVGAVAGATFGAVTEIISDGIQGRAPNWNNVAAAAIGGAVTGGLSAAGGPLLAAAGGSLGSISENLLRAGFNGTEVDPLQLGVSAVGSGLLRGGLASRADPLKKQIQRNASRRFRIPSLKAAARVETGTFWKRGPQAREGFIEKVVLKRLGLGLAANLGRDQVLPPLRKAAYSLFESDDNNGGSPSGNAGKIIQGSTGGPISTIGQGGEYLHYQKYIEALNRADRPLPSPVENLSTF